MLTIVGWLWRDKRCRTQYNARHVTVWAKMIHRHVTIPHRFVLLTDRPKDKYSELVEPLPLWNDWRAVRCKEWKTEFPQCYVRLKAFSPEMRAVLGDRFVSIDLDCVVLGNLDAILGRSEEFVICRRAATRERDVLSLYQASMWMMTAGARAQVWSEFRGETSLEEIRTNYEKAEAKRYLATDQGWMLHQLHPNEPGWTMGDGVYFWPWLRKHKQTMAPPDNASIVFFQGEEKPWNLESTPDWIKEHYR